MDDNNAISKLSSFHITSTWNPKPRPALSISPHQWCAHTVLLFLTVQIQPAAFSSVCSRCGGVGFAHQFTSTYKLAHDPGSHSSTCASSQSSCTVQNSPIKIFLDLNMRLVASSHRYSFLHQNMLRRCAGTWHHISHDIDRG